MTKIDQKIPEGWSVKKLGDMGEFISGAGFPESEQGGKIGIPFYKVSDMNLPENKNTMIAAHNYVNQEQIKKLKYKQIKKEAIIFAKVGAAIFLERKRIAQNFLIDNNMMAFIPNENVKFLKIILDRVRLSKYVQVGALPSYNASDLRTIKILLPPLAEQKKIAEILSCWDEGIEKLSALIEKKKIQKKALMQQLLTGKHRLKGFSTPWNEVKLEDVLYEHKETSKGDETICSVSVHKGIISQIEHLGRCFAASNTSNYNLVHYGDVVYTKSPTGEFPYGIFKQSQQRKSVIVSPLYGVFTPKTYYLGYILDVFFSYAINLNNYLKPIIQKGAKNTINITNETFLSKVIFLPEETKEIKKLAEIFIKSDEEIELLNKKLEAFKLEKKALMQQLLTGQIRVKVN